MSNETIPSVKQATSTLTEARDALTRAEGRRAAAKTALAAAEADYASSQTDAQWHARMVADSAHQRAGMDVTLAEKAVTAAEKTLAEAQEVVLTEQLLETSKRADFRARTAHLIERVAAIYTELGTIDAEVVETYVSARDAHGSMQAIAKRREEHRRTREAKYGTGGVDFVAVPSITPAAKTLPRELFASLLPVTADERSRLLPTGGFSKAQEENASARNPGLHSEAKRHELTLPLNTYNTGELHQ